MSTRNTTRIPILVAAGVLVAVCALRFGPQWIGSAPVSTPLLERLELLTYDWRVRAAFDHEGPAAANLAAVFIDDEDLWLVNEELGYHWPWPRQLFGRVIRELYLQGAARVACDVFFLERHRDYAETRHPLPDGRLVSSDDYFGFELQRAGNTILGVPGEVLDGVWHALAPIDVVRTNALALGYASADRDADGVLRRARPFRDDPEHGRIWHLGILLAAGELGLDLAGAAPGRGELRLASTNGRPELRIPLDRDGLFHVDWALKWNDRRLFKLPFTDLLAVAGHRELEQVEIEPALDDHLVVIGSLGSGSNISDVGTTPLDRETYLVSLHWNVANSLLLNRWIRPPPVGRELLCILVCGVVSAVVTWRLRPVTASALLAAAMVGYAWAGLRLYIEWRYWLPLVAPLGGATVTMHLCLVVYRAVFERDEQRRVRSVFGRMVSPAVVDELLARPRVALGGAPRPLTILFADIRGFTRMTEQDQQEARRILEQERLMGPAAETFLESRAQATLASVNELLALIADEVKRHGGTLDKYIGDCVMAFWGAPVETDAHAALCVRAAIRSQQAIARLNEERERINAARQAENPGRQARGERLLPAIPLLSLGVGIHTGTALVGLMGSEEHILNYTVFGREVNVASRLEGVAESGRIIISAATRSELERLDPVLAARCLSRPACRLKGIAEPVEIFEVRWQETDLRNPGAAEAVPAGIPAGGSSG